MNIAAVSEQLTQLGINPAEAVIVGSGILGVLGIRGSRDIDVLVPTVTLGRLKAEGYHAFRYENGALGVAIGGMELMDDWFGEAEVIRANAVTVGGCASCRCQMCGRGNAAPRIVRRIGPTWRLLMHT